jgi:hypothetical protein
MRHSRRLCYAFLIIRPFKFFFFCLNSMRQVIIVTVLCQIESDVPRIPRFFRLSSYFLRLLSKNFLGHDTD